MIQILDTRANREMCKKISATVDVYANLAEKLQKALSKSNALQGTIYPVVAHKLDKGADAVICPRLQHVSDGEFTQILEYVKAGGTVIATVHSLLYDTDTKMHWRPERFKPLGMEEKGPIKAKSARLEDLLFRHFFEGDVHTRSRNIRIIDPKIAEGIGAVEGTKGERCPAVIKVSLGKGTLLYFNLQLNKDRLEKGDTIFDYFYDTLITILLMAEAPAPPSEGEEAKVEAAAEEISEERADEVAEVEGADKPHPEPLKKKARRRAPEIATLPDMPPIVFFCNIDKKKAGKEMLEEKERELVSRIAKAYAGKAIVLCANWWHVYPVGGAEDTYLCIDEALLCLKGGTEWTYTKLHPAPLAYAIPLFRGSKAPLKKKFKDKETRLIVMGPYYDALPALKGARTEEEFLTKFLEICDRQLSSVTVLPPTEAEIKKSIGPFIDELFKRWQE